MPDAYGVTESCCFCFRKTSRRDDQDVDEESDDDEFRQSLISSKSSIQNQEDLENQSPRTSGFDEKLLNPQNEERKVSKKGSVRQR